MREASAADLSNQTDEALKSATLWRLAAAFLVSPAVIEAKETVPWVWFTPETIS